MQIRRRGWHGVEQGWQRETLLVMSSSQMNALCSWRATVLNLIGQPAPLKPRPKHPAKVNVWAGISSRSPTNIIIFTGIMTATRFTDILDVGLVRFLAENYPDGRRFQQDNDPKHTSRYAQDYYARKGINWWKTPASSPDLNPIENVWGTMKAYLRNEYKPKTTTELKVAIRTFWKILKARKCQKYISHLQKVMPKVIDEAGGTFRFLVNSCMYLYMLILSIYMYI